MTSTTLDFSTVPNRERDVLGDVARQVTYMRETEICEPAPIEASGEGVVIRPEFMAVDQPILFRLLEKNVVAVKRRDDSIDFYHVP